MGLRMGALIGIDFGCSACRTAVVREGRAEPFANRFTERCPPARVEPAPQSGGEFGPAALPAVFRGLKQRAGSDKTAPGEIADLFRQLLEDAQAAVGEPVSGAVLAVPGFFPDGPRAVLRDAALRAGFPAVRLFDEALGAVMGAAKPVESGAVLVYSLGAGVFSASVVRAGNGRPRVLSSEGRRFLGGNDFDAALMGLILDRLGRPRDLEGSTESIPRLKILAEQVKIGLSRREREEFDVSLAELFGQGGGVSLSVERSEFEEAIAAAVEATMTLASKAVEAAGLPPGGVDQVLLAGRSTRIPLIERRLKQQFLVPPTRAKDDDIALGAAVQAGQMAEADWKRSEPAPAVPPPQPAPPPAAVPAPRSDAAGPSTWLPLFSPLLLEAEELWNRGQQPAAIGKFQEMLEQGKRYLGTLCHEVGKSCARARRFDEAIRYLEAALAHSPSDRLARHTYHETLRDKARELRDAGRLREARNTILQALQLSPKCETCNGIYRDIEQALRSQPKSLPSYQKPKRRR